MIMRFFKYLFKILLNWKTILLICIVWWIIYYYYFYKKEDTSETIIAFSTVKIWNIENWVKVSWKANLVDEQQLRFNQVWKVTNVYFKDWDKIKKWEIIAQLDMEDLNNSIEQAQISLENSKLNYEKLIRPPEQKDILSSKNSINNTKNNILSLNDQLNILNKEYDNKKIDFLNQINSKQNDINKANQDLETQENELDILQKQQSKNLSDLNVDLQNSLKNAFTDSKNYIIDVKDKLETVDEIMWFSDKYFNNDTNIDYDLSDENLVLKEKIKQYWLLAKENLLISQKKIDSINQTNLDVNEIKNILELNKLLFISMIDLWKIWTDNIKENIYLAVFDLNTENAINIAYTDSRKSLIDAKNLLDDVDEIYWFSDINKDKNDSIENFLSAKNTSLKNSTYDLWFKSKNILESNQNEIDILDWKKLNFDKVINILNQNKNLYNSMIELWKYASEWVKASVSSNSYSQSQIDSNYSSMLSIISSSQSNYDKLVSSIKNLDSLTQSQNDSNYSDFFWIISSSQSDYDKIVSTMKSIDTLSDLDTQKLNDDNNFKKKLNLIEQSKINIKQLEKDLEIINQNFLISNINYENQISQKKLDIKSQTDSLNLNEEQYSYLMRWPTQEDLESAKNDIKKQELNLQNTKKSIDKYQLEAPFDWIITKIDFKVWDNIVSDEQKYVYIQNPNLIELSAELDQIDIVKVQVWQNAKITFDSYPDIEFDWIISEIDSTPISSSWVTSYSIKISLDKWEFKIFSWMTAKIDIIIESIENVLTIPSSYLQKDKWKTSVLVNSWDDSKQIEIWISNSLQTQVLSWLNEWDLIYRKIVVSNASATQTTLLPTPWWWRWMWQSSRSFWWWAR